MSVLLDTNVVSETRKARPAPAVAAWHAAAAPGTLFVSVLTLGELDKGIARLRRRDPGGAAALAAWREGLETLFADRLLPIDAAVAARWGALNAARDLPVIDSLLAATALVHDLTLVTRNLGDVTGTGVRVVDPWAG